MIRNIFLAYLLIPILAYGQGASVLSYQEGLDACKQIVKENQKKNPDKYIYTGPDCMIGAGMPQFIASMETRPRTGARAPRADRG